MKTKTILAFAAGIIGLTASANAAVVNYYASWSGASLGNSASAYASFKLDTDYLGTQISNGSRPEFAQYQWITDIDLTVTGAASGNGHFTSADYYDFAFGAEGPVDFAQELVGQANLIDFNLFNRYWDPTTEQQVSSAAPGASRPNTLQVTPTGGGQGEEMRLTSLSATPAFRATTTLLDNTSAGISPYMTFNLPGLAFSTGSQAFSLDSIEFAPRGDDQTGNLTLSLYAADASTHLPTSDSALATKTFSNILFDHQPTSTSVAFSNDFTLAANSSYVLAFSSPVSGFRGLAGIPEDTATPVSVGTSGLTFHGLAWNFESWGGPYNLDAPYVKLTATAASGGTSAVPEASTSLGLLALGAGGLLTRRRLKRKA
ncbi:MAG: hypothetical protein RLZZ214_1804 [Verrucomicrobiota bacterium]|jgi:hypothetical protein